MVDLILTSLDDNKAQDVLAIDLVGKTSIADRMIITSGTSGRMVSAMAEHLSSKLRQAGMKPKSEGEKYGDWVVIDAGDVIVHLFRPEVRTFYSIERIWAAPAKPDVAPKTLPKPKAKARQEGKPKPKEAPRVTGKSSGKSTAKKPSAKLAPKPAPKPAARKPAKRS